MTAIGPILESVRAVFDRYPKHQAGVTLANSFPGLAFRPGAKAEWDEGIVIGLSGEGILPISYLTLAKAAGFGCRISGNGGPMNYRQAADFLALGAETVQFCTLALHYGLEIVEDLHAGLSGLLEALGLSSVAELIGRALPRPIRDFPDLPALKRISAVERRLCVHCGNCARCPYQAIELDRRGIPRTDPARCIGCSLCVQRCFAGALSMRERSAAERAAAAGGLNGRRVLLIVNGPIFTGGEDFELLEGHGLLLEDGRIARIAPVAGAGLRGRAPDRRPGQARPARPDQRPHALLQHPRPRPGQGRPGPRLQRSAAQPLVAARPQAHARRHLLQRPDHDAGRRSPRHDDPDRPSRQPRGDPGSLERIARAGMETGLRIGLAYEISDRDGRQAAAEGLAENAAGVRFCRERGGEHLRGLIGLHASFTLSDETLDRAAALAAELGVGCHIHVAEAASDQEDCLSRHGLRVVERLRTPRHPRPEDDRRPCRACRSGARSKRSPRRGTMVVHNPQSNLNNAVGIADITAMKAAGVLVGLGTDAMTVNMLEELRAALWAQHYGGAIPPRVSWKRPGRFSAAIRPSPSASGGSPWAGSARGRPPT